MTTDEKDRLKQLERENPGEGANNPVGGANKNKLFDLAQDGLVEDNTQNLESDFEQYN